MKKSKAQKDILYISISSFILVAVWVALNLYHAHVTSTIAPDLQMQIVPIDPKFNTGVIEKIKSRKRVEPVFELDQASGAAQTIPTSNTDTQQTGTNSAEQSPINPILNP